MAEEKLKPIKIPVVPEIQHTATEKFAFDSSEIDRQVDIGDVHEIVIRGEVIGFEDGRTKIVYRKTGKARAQGDTSRLTIEEMAERLPKADQ